MNFTKQIKTNLESEVLLAAAVVGLGPVGVEVDGVALVGQVPEELVLAHQLRPEVVDLLDAVVVLPVHPRLEVAAGGLAVAPLLVQHVVQPLVLG